MKKIFSIFIVLTLMVSMLAGCTTEDTTSEGEDTNPPVEENSDENAEVEEEEETEEGQIVKIGLGHSISISKSKDLDGENGPVGQVDNVVAAVAFDKDDKVVEVSIDTAQTKVNFDTDLQLVSDVNAENKTKMELGDDYGMAKRSEIGKEWYEQIEALEDWMVGKSIDEITSMNVKERDENHKHVPDVPELTSSVTITVEGYLAAVEEAYNKAVELEASGETLGLGHNISIAKSKSAADDKGPVAQVDTTLAATAFDKDGNVAGTVIDTAQTKIEFDAEGKIVTDKAADFKTKIELGDDYGMAKRSEIGKEWYEQIEALEDWMVGKSIDEITSMNVKERDENHKHVPDVPELTSSVTITVEGYLGAVEESYSNAK